VVYIGFVKDVRRVVKLHFAISAVQAKKRQIEERIEKIEEKLKSWNI